MTSASSKKPIFQQFVEANEDMLKCFESADQDQYRGKDTSSVCTSQKERVKEILRSNQMTMTRVVKERVMIMKAMETQQMDVEGQRIFDEPFNHHK